MHELDDHVLAHLSQWLPNAVRSVCRRWNELNAPRQRLQTLRRIKQAQARAPAAERRGLGEARFLIELLLSPRRSAAVPTRDAAHRRQLCGWAEALGLAWQRAPAPANAPQERRLHCPYCRSRAVRITAWDEYEDTLRCFACGGTCWTGYSTRSNAWKHSAALCPQAFLQLTKH
jgi:hypothetical protein